MKRMLVLGATSEIAEAALFKFAEEGWTFHLAGRNQHHLAHLAKELAQIVEEPVPYSYFDTALPADEKKVFWHKVLKNEQYQKPKHIRIFEQPTADESHPAVSSAHKAKAKTSAVDAEHAASHAAASPAAMSAAAHAAPRAAAPNATAPNGVAPNGLAPNAAASPNTVIQDMLAQQLHESQQKMQHNAAHMPQGIMSQLGADAPHVVQPQNMPMHMQGTLQGQMPQPSTEQSMMLQPNPQHQQNPQFLQGQQMLQGQQSLSNGPNMMAGRAALQNHLQQNATMPNSQGQAKGFFENFVMAQPAQSAQNAQQVLQAQQGLQAQQVQPQAPFNGMQMVNNRNAATGHSTMAGFKDIQSMDEDENTSLVSPIASQFEPQPTVREEGSSIKEEKRADNYENETTSEEYEEEGEGIDAVFCAVGFLVTTDKIKYAHHAALILESNYSGLVPVIDLAAQYFENKGEGQIVVISSVAGLRGRASNYHYGAAKAAMNAYLSGLRARLTRKGVSVTTVLPGYVDTKMLEGRKIPKFMKANPDKVAAQIVKATNKRRSILYTPYCWRLITALGNMIPEFIFKHLSRL